MFIRDVQRVFVGTGKLGLETGVKPAGIFGRLLEAKVLLENPEQLRG